MFLLLFIYIDITMPIYVYFSAYLPTAYLQATGFFQYLFSFRIM